MCIRDRAYPVTKEFREQLNTAVLQAYEAKLEQMAERGSVGRASISDQLKACLLYTSSPISYYKSEIGVDLDKYLCLINAPMLKVPMYKKYCLQRCTKGT